MEEKSLAMEMLQELKRSSKRWFIISIVELLIIIGMIISFFVYESSFEYETVTEEQSIEQSSIDNSSITQNIK